MHEQLYDMMPMLPQTHKEFRKFYYSAETDDMSTRKLLLEINKHTSSFFSSIRGTTFHLFSDKPNVMFVNVVGVALVIKYTVQCLPSADVQNFVVDMEAAGDPTRLLRD